jgi:hypothetical protein
MLIPTQTFSIPVFQQNVWDLTYVGTIRLAKNMPIFNQIRKL